MFPPITVPEAGVSELPCEDDDSSSYGYSAKADGAKVKYKRAENEHNSESVIANYRISEIIVVDVRNSSVFGKDVHIESSFLQEHISSVQRDITLYPLFVNRPALL
jgi:hypothetical protein